MNGILYQWTSPATPQSKEVSEHRNRTLLDMVPSMMGFTDLPAYLWGHALLMATKLLNNVHTKVVQQTPSEQKTLLQPF